MSTSSVAIECSHMAHLLKDLLGHPVVAKETEPFTPHPVTRCGLVTNDDQLVGIIAADLHFAHLAGAALAMIPGGAVDDRGVVNEEWIEFYREVANVLSRTVNEASPQRVRLDPGIEHDDAALNGIVESGGLTAAEVTIDGYGTGRVLAGVNGLAGSFSFFSS